MTKYGCWNRPALKQTAIVQNGYIEYSRTPKMLVIPDPMTKTCIYQRDKKDDPKCIGCKELEK